MSINRDNNRQNILAPIVLTEKQIAEVSGAGLPNPPKELRADLPPKYQLEYPWSSIVKGPSPL